MVRRTSENRNGGSHLHTVQKCDSKRSIGKGVSSILYSRQKYHGKWHEEEQVLFPGYVFMVTDDLNQLHMKLRNVLGLTKLLGTGQEIIPLTEEEVDFLLTFGKEEQCVEMSEGIIEQDKVRILKGPLKGMEGYIRKIDRHKRKAFLEIQMFGRTVEMQVGLEIVRKC